MKVTSIHPIDNIEWAPVEEFNANDYNPNRVLTNELKLLKFSLKVTKWIQPILAVWEERDGKRVRVIVDGYHRWWLTSNDVECRALTDGKVPCVMLELSIVERMLLTIRINRAKGVHMALSMANIVKEIITVHGMSKEAVAESIGADMSEIDLLLLDSVFAQKGVREAPYGQAWVCGKDGGELYK